MTCPLTGVVPGPVKVKVELSMVDGFIASLKAAVTMVLGQAPLAPLGGATDITVGRVKLGFPPPLSGSLHPVATRSSRNDMKQIV